MRSQQAAAQLRVGILRERIRLHQVGDEADRRLGQRVETVEKTAPLVGDVAQLESPLRACEPGSRVRGPKRR